MSLSASAKTSPVKTEGGFPGESSPGKAPESSPKRSDRLFENPIPDFKPSTEYSMSGKQENQPENSPSTSPSDPGLQAGSYESSGQAFPSQAISMTDAPVLGPCAGSPLQYGSNVQLTDVFTVAQTECTGSKSPDSLDQAYSLGEQGSAELSPTQHQPLDTGSPSSLPTIPEGQVDTREQDFSPTKSDSVSAYDYGTSTATASLALRQTATNAVASGTAGR